MIEDRQAREVNVDVLPLQASLEEARLPVARMPHAVPCMDLVTAAVPSPRRRSSGAYGLEMDEGDSLATLELPHVGILVLPAT